MVEARVVVRELVQMGEGDLSPRDRIIVVTFVRESCRPCSSSTHNPIRNCSTSNGAESHSIPISSPIRCASSALNVFAEAIRVAIANADLIGN
jgi:hypothetical protein